MMFELITKVPLPTSIVRKLKVTDTDFIRNCRGSSVTTLAGILN